jgi:hypothetical protein
MVLGSRRRADDAAGHRRLVRNQAETWRLYCFRDEANAKGFVEHFGGITFDPKKTARTAVLKARAGRTNIGRSPQAGRFGSIRLSSKPKKVTRHER